MPVYATSELYAVTAGLRLLPLQLQTEAQQTFRALTLSRCRLLTVLPTKAAFTLDMPGRQT